MAEKEPIKLDAKPLFTFNKEGRAEMERIKADFERSTAMADDFEALGLDVSRLRNTIERGKKMSEVILKYMDSEGNV